MLFLESECVESLRWEMDKDLRLFSNVSSDTASDFQNIFHGAMSLDQLYFARPVPAYSSYQSPIQGLFLCGSGAHPGMSGRGRVNGICKAAIKKKRHKKCLPIVSLWEP